MIRKELRVPTGELGVATGELRVAMGELGVATAMEMMVALLCDDSCGRSQRAVSVFLASDEARPTKRKIDHEKILPIYKTVPATGKGRKADRPMFYTRRGMWGWEHHVGLKTPGGPPLFPPDLDWRTRRETGVVHQRG